MSEFVMNSADEEIIKSLKISSAISIIAGSWSLLFEIFYFHFFEIDIYIARVLFTIISLSIFLFSFRNISQLVSTILIHILIISLIGSFVYTIYKIPSTLFINSQILSLLVFTTALIFSWEVKNQIFVAIYYNILFAGSIIFNGSNIFLLPNLFSITIFVCLISLLSVVASAVNYNRMKIFRAKTNEINYIFNSIPIGICRTNLEGNIITQNKFLSRILKFEEGSAPINLFEIISDKAFGLYFSMPNFPDSESNEFSVEYVNQDNNKKYLRIISNIKKNESNKSYIDFIIKDQTAELLALNKQKEAALKLLNETKEKEQIAQMRIHEKNQKLQLLAKINHEVRTPLNSILLFHDMVDENILKSIEDIKVYSKSVKISSSQLLYTINNFIDYAKIETGKIEVEKEIINITDELHSIIELLKPIAFSKNIQLNLSVSNSSLNLAYTDAIKYRQILINLITNSIKFTKVGSVKVLLNNVHLSGDNYLITNTISDTGIGISQDKLTTIFNPFVSLNDGEITEHSSGLGLAICKEFIQLLNGHIEVTSTPNEGTMFTVTIPYECKFLLYSKES